MRTDLIEQRQAAQNAELDLRAEIDRLRAALSWIEDQDPQIVDAAREKFALGADGGWKGRGRMSEYRERACTCHPDEAPRPCPQRYAYSECVLAAEIDRLRAILLNVALTLGADCPEFRQHIGLGADGAKQLQKEGRMSGTVELPIPHCPQCRLLSRLLREARDRIPDWVTGVNRELLAEIDAALAAASRALEGGEQTRKED